MSFRSSSSTSVQLSWKIPIAQPRTIPHSEGPRTTSPQVRPTFLEMCPQSDDESDADCVAECLSGLAHRAAPTDIWSLGVLLCVLLTGTGPWEDLRHCLVGMIRLKKQVEPLAFDLIKRCLNSNPDFRITIRGVRNHPWVVGDRIKPLKVM